MEAGIEADRRDVPDDECPRRQGQNLGVGLSSPFQAGPQPAANEAVLGIHDRQHSGYATQADVGQGLDVLRFTDVQSTKKEGVAAARLRTTAGWSKAQPCDVKSPWRRICLFVCVLQMPVDSFEVLTFGLYFLSARFLDTPRYSGTWARLTNRSSSRKPRCQVAGKFCNVLALRRS